VARGEAGQVQQAQGVGMAQQNQQAIANPQARSASANKVQQRETMQTQDRTGLANALLGAQAAGQGRSMYDQNAQLAALMPQLQAQQHGQTLGAVANEQQAINDYQLQSRLAQLSQQPNSNLASGLGVASQLFNTAGALAGAFGGQGGGTSSIAQNDPTKLLNFAPGSAASAGYAGGVSNMDLWRGLGSVPIPYGDF